MIPPFEPGTGNLPPGVHEATWDEFVERYGYTEHRRRLLAGLREAIDALALAGCRRVYVNGSFVTAKEVPEDYDTCWERDGVDIGKLVEIAPELIDFRDLRSAQKARFGGELFPANMAANREGTPFRQFFQHDKRTNEPKGLIVITPGAP